MFTLIKDRTPSAFDVTEKAMRPVSAKRECFYCHQAVGDKHLFACVLVKRDVIVKTIITHTVSVPAHWTKEDIEFHRRLRPYTAAQGTA